VEANLLVILTDQAGVFDCDPRVNPDARLIADADAGHGGLREAASSASSSGLGSGGMATKVRAAELAARSGTYTWIVSGRETRVLEQLAGGAALGTLVHPASTPLAARKRWLAGQLQAKGRLILDDGAVRVLKQAGRSLLPVGVTAVEGAFRRGEVVSCCDAGGNAIARGLVNYAADEARRIIGQPSERIEQLLGYVDEPELIHRDNLVLL
jgi:glutamate 5-kinase